MTSSDVTRQIERISERLDLDPTDDRVTELAEDVQEYTALLDSLDELDDAGPTVGRDSWTPTDDEDPFGAFLTRCRVRERRDGNLSGTTVGVKDNIAVADVPMTSGSPLLEGYVPRRDATVVERLLEAGATVVGKTNMDEFAMGHDDSTMRLRTARNPRDEDCLAGGSSTGSAIAVAEGLADVALGSDTGGSVRLPASWCGVVGIKPTRGLVSHHGFVQYAKTLDTIGVLGRDLRTVATTLETIAGPDPRDERTAGAQVEAYATAVERGSEERGTDLSVGVPLETFGRAAEPEACVRTALDGLEDAGASLQEVSIPDLEYALPAWIALSVTEFAAYFLARMNNFWLLTGSDLHLSRAVHERLEERIETIGPRVIDQLVLARYLNDEYGNQYYALAQRARRRLSAAVDEALDGVDVLACPTTPLLPTEATTGIEDVRTFAINTRPFSVTGHPAVTLPVGFVDDLPVGIQFVGPRYDEASVLYAAARLRECVGEIDE